MTREQLAAIRARCEAASPAEHWGQQWGGTLGRGEIRVGPPGEPAVSRFMFTAPNFGNAGTAHPDFVLAISAPADVRALLAEVERLEAERDEAVETLNDAHATMSDEAKRQIDAAQREAERLTLERDEARNERFKFETQWNAAKRALAEAREYEKRLRAASDEALDVLTKRLAAAEARELVLRTCITTLRKRTDFVFGATKNAAWERFLFEQREGFDALLAAPTDDTALREFGLRVARAIWSPHVSAEGQRQIEKAVDAVLKGAR